MDKIRKMMLNFFVILIKRLAFVTVIVWTAVLLLLLLSSCAQAQQGTKKKVIKQKIRGLVVKYGESTTLCKEPGCLVALILADDIDGKVYEKVIDIQFRDHLWSVKDKIALKSGDYIEVIVNKNADNDVLSIEQDIEE